MTNEAMNNDTPTPLSQRVRPGSEAAPWVCDEIVKLERELETASIPICIGPPIIGHLARDGQWVSEDGRAVIAADGLFKADPYERINALERELADAKAYKDAIDTKLVCAHLGVAKGKPAEELHEIIRWEIGVQEFFEVDKLRQELAASKAHHAKDVQELNERLTDFGKSHLAAQARDLDARRALEKALSVAKAELVQLSKDHMEFTASYEKELLDAGQAIGDSAEADIERLQSELAASQAREAHLKGILDAIDLSPCNGGSCMVATAADELIESARCTPPSVIPLAEVKALVSVLQTIHDDADGYADGAPDASAHDKLCAQLVDLTRPLLSIIKSKHPELSK